jgi:hypothetical protein
MVLMMQSCGDPDTSSVAETEEPVAAEATNEFESGSETLAAETGEMNDASIKDKICSEAGYVWENVNNEADIYTAISFNGDEFKMASYSMNGSQNPQEFTRVVDFAGAWETLSEREIEGTISGTNTKVQWTFNDAYTSMVNNKGVAFQKVGIN